MRYIACENSGEGANYRRYSDKILGAVPPRIIGVQAPLSDAR